MICPLCASTVDDDTPIAELHDAKCPTNGGVIFYYYCQACEAVWHEERITQDYYKAQYRDVQQGIHGILEDEIRLQTARAKTLAPILNMIMRDFKPKTSLDMGASAGVLVNACEKLGLEASGVEIDETYSNYALHAYGYNFSGLDGFHDKYDLVTCIHTLEHLVNPLADLRKLREAASLNAVILIEVPDFFTSPLSLSYVHKFAFTEQSLYNVMRAAGWFPAWIIKFWGIYSNFTQPSNLLALGLGGTPMTRFEYNQQTARLGQSIARKA